MQTSTGSSENIGGNTDSHLSTSPQSVALCILTFTPLPGLKVKESPFLILPVISNASITSYLCKILTTTKLASVKAYCSTTRVSSYFSNTSTTGQLTSQTNPRPTREPNELPSKLPPFPTTRSPTRSIFTPNILSSMKNVC